MQVEQWRSSDGGDGGHAMAVVLVAGDGGRVALELSTAGAGRIQTGVT